MLHSLHGNEDHLLTHLSNFIAANNKDGLTHQLVEPDSESTLVQDAKHFDWLNSSRRQAHDQD